MLSFLVWCKYGCIAAYNETSRVLTEDGFGHVSEQFVEEEIGVRQIPALPDQVLVNLQISGDFLVAVV